jgi:hypothetical protein
MNAPAQGNRQQAQLLRPVDDVATALSHLAKGTIVRMTSGSVAREVTLQEDIAAGHKFAVRAIKAGERIVKYGAPIGRATRDIQPGDYVHLDNVESDYIPTYTLDDGHQFLKEAH